MTPESKAETLEQEIQEPLATGSKTLGVPAPRLLTEKPLVAANGLRHGLTGQYTYLNDEDLVLYLQSGAEFILEMRPVGIRENHLLQRIIDADWRLNRIPFLQNTLLAVNELREAKKIRTNNPDLDEETIELYAQADSFHAGVNDLDKLSRHETRLSRLLDSMHKEYERRQERISKLRFNHEESKAYLWYTKTLTVVEQLMAEKAVAKAQAKAEKERLKAAASAIAIETTPTTSTNQTTSNQNLVCKNAPQPAGSITENATETTPKTPARTQATSQETEINLSNLPGKQAA